MSVHEIPTELQYLIGESASGYWIFSTRILSLYRNSQALSLKTSANQTSFQILSPFEYWTLTNLIFRCFWYSNPHCSSSLKFLFYQKTTIAKMQSESAYANFKLVYFSDSLCTFGNLIAQHSGGLNTEHQINKLLTVCPVFRCPVFRSLVFKWWFSNQKVV